MSKPDYQDSFDVILTRTIKDGKTTFVASLGPGMVNGKEANTIPGALIYLATAIENWAMDWAMEAFAADLRDGKFDHLAGPR